MRYILHDKLGEGGMGVVFQAMDRLTHKTVALKQIKIKPQQMVFDTLIDGGSSSNLLLAREFQMLASLRHPHIIDVLDYGFELGRPYFTMTLLENPRTIREAAYDDQTKTHLLIQTLQALAYMHHRGIIHRDLKPGNILVDDQDRVKVLDFGLALARDLKDDGGTGGTLAYISPEVLQGYSATAPSDLYAVGVIAYELFVGRHPIDLSGSLQTMLHILQTPPDLDPLPPRLRLVVGKLLEKMPEYRYQNALDAIHDLSAAMRIRIDQESIAIRESFLKAARFIGRKPEMALLSGALDRLLEGEGSAWLIAGESGVGKSRLIDEIRTRALVAEVGANGVTVLFGQGVEGGGLPYQLWREPVRRLLLATDVELLQASILKQIVPDISDLLGKDVPDAPPVDPDLNQQRLIMTIAELFNQQSQPVLLILEDLHWADESLEPLKVLLRIQDQLNLIIVGSYRDDERPHLPDDLPQMQRITLERFDDEGIESLAVAMLGETRPSVLKLLKRETEGNVFFLVEVIRALAEDAGSLQEIGSVTLPPRVFAEGMRSVVRHRLERTPQWGWELLQYAACIGRQIDRKLLAALDALPPDQTLDNWLRLCADAAVLTLRNEQWFFAHDKLREGLLSDIMDKPALHQQIAEVIQAVYVDEIEFYYDELAYHYGQAGNLELEREYAWLAGEAAALRFANHDALRFISRALELSTDADEQRVILHLRERIYHTLGERDKQLTDIEALTRLAISEKHQTAVALCRARFYHAIADYPQALAAAEKAAQLAPESRAEAHLEIARVHFSLSDFDAAQSHAAQSLTIAQAEELDAIRAQGLLMVASIYYHRDSDYETAQRYYQWAQTLCNTINDLRGEARALNSLGNTSGDLGDPDAAEEYYEEALEIYQRIGEKSGEADVLTNLAIYAGQQNDFVQARDYMEQALYIYKQINHRNYVGIALTNLGTMTYNMGDYFAAQDYLHAALELRDELGDKRGTGITLINLAQMYHLMGEHETALGYCQQAIEVGEEIEIPILVIYARNNQAHALNGAGLWDEAEPLYRELIAQWQEMDQLGIVMENIAGLARLYLRKGDLNAAFDQVELILPHLQSGALDTAEDLLRIHLTCYQVLMAVRDDRAEVVLQRAYSLLKEQAEAIRTPEARTMYLQNIAAHRAIMETWESSGSLR